MQLDLGAYLDDDGLVLNGIKSKKHPDGKTYTVASPDALDGLRLQRIMAIDESGTSSTEQTADMIAFCKDADGNPINYEVKILGPAVHAEMIADGLSEERLQRVVGIVAAYYTMGAQFVEKVVASVGEASAAQGSDQSAPSTPPTSRSTAGSSSKRASTGTPARTRKPASTRSSTSTPRKAPAKAARKTA